MIPPYLVTLTLPDGRTIPGVVTVDHGPAVEYRFLVVCAGYEEFPRGIYHSPGALFVIWASDADIECVEQVAA